MANTISQIASTPFCGLGTQTYTATVTGLYTCEFKVWLPYFAAGTPAQSTVVANNVQTVTAVADSSGSLNSTYWVFYTTGNLYGYYVWYNINSAGVDPAPAGLTGIQVTGATNASSSTLGGNTRTAIAAAVPYVTVTGSTSAITISQNYYGGVTAAADSVAAPTGFTFGTSSPAGTYGVPAASGLNVVVNNNAVPILRVGWPTPTQPYLSGAVQATVTATQALTVVLTSLSTADAAPNAVKGIINIFPGEGQ